MPSAALGRCSCRGDSQCMPSVRIAPICSGVEPWAKWPLLPNSSLWSKFYPWNIQDMPVVKFFAGFNSERKFSL
jgi:hypothetical protein